MATIASDAFICGGQVSGLIAARVIADAGYKAYVQEWTSELGGMCVAGVLQVDYSARPPSGRANQFWLAVKARAEALGNVWDGTNAPGGLHPANGLPRNVSPLWVLYAIEQLINHPNITVVRNVDILKVYKNPVSKRLTAVDLSNGDTVTFKGWYDCSYESWLAANVATGIPHDYGRLDRILFNEPASGNADYNATIDPNDAPPYPVRRTNGNLHRHRTHRPSLPDGWGSLTTMGFNWRYMMSTRPNRVSWDTAEAPLLDLGYRPQDFTDFLSELVQRNATNIGHIASCHPVDGTDANGLHTTNPTNMNEIMLARKYPLLTTPDQCRAFRDKMFLATVGRIFTAWKSPDTTASLKAALTKYQLPAEVYQTRYHRLPGWPPQPYIRSCRRARGQYVITEANYNLTPSDPVCHAGYNPDSHQHFWYWDPAIGRSKKEGGIDSDSTRTWLVPWRAFKPHKQHCANGLLGWNGSQSYFMSTDMRIETVQMMQGEVAGIGLAEAFRQDIDVVDLPYESVRPLLIAAGSTVSL